MSDPNASRMNPMESSEPSKLVYSRGALLGAPKGAGRKLLAAMPRSEKDTRARTQDASLMRRIIERRFLQ